MSQRQTLILRRDKIKEIRNIMSSMKTLALMETHKLEDYIKKQSLISDTILSVAADFLYFYPNVLPDVARKNRSVNQMDVDITLLIGAQRGFCGSFNEQLIKLYGSILKEQENSNSILIVVGNKLHQHYVDNGLAAINIEGAEITEAIPVVVNSLAKTLTEQRTVEQSTMSLNVIHHLNNHDGPVMEKLLPPFEHVHDIEVSHSHAPLLNLSVTEFFLDLTEHFLINALNLILHQSLMVENRWRAMHLENATSHLDKNCEKLNLKINKLRQEEIIEEIEVKLLNTSQY